MFNVSDEFLANCRFVNRKTFYDVLEENGLSIFRDCSETLQNNTKLHRIPSFGLFESCHDRVKIHH